MGNTNTTLRDSYSNTQELIEINKLSQQYLSILFNDDPHATQDYDESRSDFMLRSRPSMWLYDKLTYEQKKILVSEFYNISKELKNKLLNTNGKLKYLQQYEIAYTDCGGVSKYSSISLNFRPPNTSHKFNEDDKYRYSATTATAVGGGRGIDVETQQLLRKVSALEAEVLELKKISSVRCTETQPDTTARMAPYITSVDLNDKEEVIEQKNVDIIKRFAYKLVDWDNNLCGGMGPNIPFPYGCKSSFYYKDMIENAIKGISFDKISLLTTINELYKDIIEIETNCYISKNMNESEALLRLNEVFIKYSENNHIVNITSRFIPNILGVRGESSRCGHTQWFGVDNYISLIKTRICIFQEFYSNIHI